MEVEVLLDDRKIDVGNYTFGTSIVTNFLENSIAIIDLRPGSPTETRVVMRLFGREAE